MAEQFGKFENKVVPFSLKLLMVAFLVLVRNSVYSAYYTSVVQSTRNSSGIHYAHYLHQMSIIALHYLQIRVESYFSLLTCQQSYQSQIRFLLITQSYIGCGCCCLYTLFNHLIIFRSRNWATSIGQLQQSSVVRLVGCRGSLKKRLMSM